MRELWAFRRRLGYDAPFFAQAQERGPEGAPPPVEARIAETQRLFAEPGLPRPRDAFESFCLLLHLFASVENKYLGPYDPRRPSPHRSSLYKGGVFFTAAHSPAAVIGVQREFCFLLDPAGAIALAARASVGDMPFAVAVVDRYAPLRAYVWARARPPAPAALPAKGERLDEFFAALAEAPAPEDRLQALVLVNSLLGAMENSYPSLAGTAGLARMLGVMPYAVHETSARPGAVLLLSIAHVLCYYPDGTVEIYLRDPARDQKDGMRTTSIVLKALLARRAGRRQLAAA
jgi:hypothetical protein